MNNPRHPLRINVGFILHEEAGHSHEFDFDLPAVKLGIDFEVAELLGHLTIARTAQGLLFTGDFSAETELTCVRCLAPYSQFLKWNLTEVYSMSEKSLGDSGQLIPEDAQIDLQPLMREYALLEIPIKPICRSDCRGLCPVCGEDLNQRDCGHRAENDQSPFSALRDFLN